MAISRLLSGGLRRGKAIARNPHFGVILVLLALCTVHHYAEQIGFAPPFPDSYLGLTRRAVDRVFYLVPVIYAGYIFGVVGGLATTLVALALMLPRALFISASPPDALLETAMVSLVGILASLLFGVRSMQTRLLDEQRQAIAAMMLAQEKLRTQVRNTMKYQKELTALSSLSGLLGRPTEMRSPLRPVIDTVMEVVGGEVVLIFSLDGKTDMLTLIGHEGVSPEFAQSISRMKLGEDFGRHVLDGGEPIRVEEALPNSKLAREGLGQENLGSQLIVPMKFRDKVMGMLCVAVHKPRAFTIDEVELLTVISGGIGIAIENARLWQEQRTAMAQLRHSEEHYRELFERAHDAIWVHDFDGNILSANRAAEALTGYTIEELSRMNVKDFLSSKALGVAREVRQCLLEGKPINQPYEQRVSRRNGTEAALRLTTNLIWSDGQPRAFQNIARDITEEKRMEENLRSYVQQITRAQEEERLRIARELHDSTAQNLIALLHRLEEFLRDRATLPVDEVRELWAFHEQVKDVLQEVRYLSRDLRPSIIDDVGLIPTLHWAVRQLRAEYGVEASLKIEGVERRFSTEGELILFRIVQESLRNIGKHSRASKAEVLIAFQEGKVSVLIKDNGAGFQLPEKVSDLSRSGKLGLMGMQERVQLLGGSLEIQSEAGKGTTVRIEAPI